MSLSTPTPRTDSEIRFTGPYTCTHHSDQMRAACPVCLVAALATERDQLRADCENETKWAAHYLAQSIAEKARAERAEASLHAAKEECTDVRLKWHAVMGMCAAKEDSIMEADEELVCLRARAELAEAEVGRLRAGIAECLRTNGHLADGEDCTLISLKRCLRAIDAGMKEDAK